PATALRRSLSPKSLAAWTHGDNPTRRFPEPSSTSLVSVPHTLIQLLSSLPSHLPSLCHQLLPSQSLPLSLLSPRLFLASQPPSPRDHLPVLLSLRLPRLPLLQSLSQLSPSTHRSLLSHTQPR